MSTTTRTSPRTTTGSPPLSLICSFVIARKKITRHDCPPEEEKPMPLDARTYPARARSGRRAGLFTGVHCPNELKHQDALPAAAYTYERIAQQAKGSPRRPYDHVRQAEVLEAPRQRPAPGGGGRGGRPRGPRAHGADPRDGRASLREPEAHRAARGAPEVRGLPQGPGAAPGARAGGRRRRRAARRRRGRGGLQPASRSSTATSPSITATTRRPRRVRRALAARALR